MIDVKQRITELSPERRALLEQRLLRKKAAPSADSLPSEKIEPAVSLAQEALWFLWRMAPENPVYNIPQAFRIKGSLNVPVLKSALEKVVARHEILRTFYAADKGAPMPVLHPTPISMEVRALEGSLSDEEIRKLVESEAQRPFSLDSAPPFRATLFQVSSQEFLLLFSLHHIAGDHWSIQLLIQELAAAYKASLQNSEADFPELKIQYSLYAGKERKRLLEKNFRQQLGFWKEHLEGIDTVLELPADFPRPTNQSFKGGRELIVLPAELATKVASAAKEHGVTVFMFLMAAFQALIYRYTNQRKFLVGTPLGGRSASETERLVGLFVNLLPVRALVDQKQSFRDFVSGVRNEILEVFSHSQTPFDLLVKEFNIGRDSSRTPLVQAVFQYQTEAINLLEIPGAITEHVELHTGTSKFDLELTLASCGNQIKGFIEYNSDIFTAETIGRFRHHFVNIVSQFIANPEVTLDRVEFISEEERRQLLVDWAGIPTLSPVTHSVPALFEEQVRRSPNSPAITFQDQQLTYAELNARANDLAHFLISQGVSKGDLVGIALPRSIDLIVSTLAILKAGAAYVPFDPAYPGERLQYMVSDSGVSLVITASDSTRTKFACKSIDLEELSLSRASNSPGLIVGPEDTAYVMYTSGSTGKPKGTAIPHRGIVRLVRETNYLKFSADDVFLHFAPASFDAATLEIWGPLLNGGKLVLFPSATASLRELAEVLVQEKVTTLWLTSGLFNQMVDLHLDALRGLKYLLAGGDVLSVAHVERVLRELPCQLINGYGPTENTTFTCCYPIPKNWWGASVPIGSPITNTYTYILDESLQPVPQGVLGELYIGGAGLAQAYWNAPELTREKFLPDPFRPGQTLYRSGDVVRFQAGGLIEFIGRKDGQVKIRGFRIETGEIETVIRGHPAIQDVAVVAVEHPKLGKILAAYIVKASQITPDELRNWLGIKLPAYMVPGVFQFLPALPLTPNGKVDKKALPSLELQEERKALVPPRNSTEETIHNIWSDVLGRTQISVTDNFFSLGGHSLLAIRVLARISESLNVDLPLSAIFQAPNISALAELLGKSQTHSKPLQPKARPPVLPLSFQQQRLWFLEQVNPGNPAYNIPIVLRLNGSLDRAALEKALKDLVVRHEILRTTYSLHGDRPAQQIHQAIDTSLHFRELSKSEAPNLDNILSEQLRAPFDLARDCPLKAVLYQLDANKHVLSLVLHHIAGDESSVKVLLTELSELYSSHLKGTPPALKPLPLQYADYAVLQEDFVQSEEYASQLAYWKKQLSGDPVSVELPLDKQRPARRSNKGGIEELRLNWETTENLRRLAKQEDVTIFMLLLAAFKSLIYRYTGQEDVLVGTPISGRQRVELEQLIGFFVNTLVLRTNLSGDPSFRELLRRVRENSLGAYKNQDLPFDKIVEELQPQRMVDQTPWVQVMFSLETEAPPPAFDQLAAEFLDVHTHTSKFDLLFVARNSEDHLAFLVEYNDDILESSTVRRFLRHFEQLLSSLTENPGQTISSLKLLTPQESKRLLHDWSCVRTQYPSQRTVHDLFLEQALKTPDRTALVFADKKLTYKEVREGAINLAASLQIHPGDKVGLLIERSPELIIATLAILIRGGAYVPFDPAYPGERMEFMASDLNINLVLTQSRLSNKLPKRNWTVLALDTLRVPPSECPVHDGKAEDLAYIMYTSGSTGQPKGVCVRHRGIVRLVKNTNYISITPEDVYLQLAPVAFDAATLEIWAPLLNGGTLVVAPPGNLSFVEIGEIIQKHKVTTLWLTSALFNQMVDEELDSLRGLKQLLAGGDVLSTSHVRQFLQAVPSCNLINGYGPTENTTFTCCYNIPKNYSGSRPVPIGGPIANTSVYILDSRRHPVPIGVPGELYIGGDGLAAGYHNRPELNAEKFVPDPFGKHGETVYRTGDLVKWLPDGTIDFLGRLDNQIKLRGFRIELGEIESVLRQHPSVLDAAVILSGTGSHKRLIAFVVNRNAATHDDLKQFVSEKLPEFMVPSAIVSLPELPLSPNGKVDRRKLAALKFEAPGSYRAPRTQLERTIAEIMARVLGAKQVGLQDNFFDLGGHSLLAVKLFGQIERQTGKKLPLQALFQAPTVEGLANLIRSEGWVAPGSCIVEIQPSGSRPPIFWLHTLGGGGGGGLFTYRKLALLLGGDQPSYGFVAPSEPHNSIPDMARHYIAEMRAIQPHGPYFLGGYCFGGAVAYEMAQQLEASGETVGLLALIDSTPPLDASQRPGKLVLFVHIVASFPGWLADSIKDSTELRARFKRRFRGLLGKFRPPTDANHASVNQLEQVIDMSQYPTEFRRYAEAHWKALCQYSPKPFNGPIFLMRTAKRHLLSLEPEDLWLRLCSKVEVITVPGAHDQVMHDPHVEVVAAKLNDKLNLLHK